MSAKSPRTFSPSLEPINKRQIVRIKKDETALIIRKDNSIDIAGSKHLNVMIPLSSILMDPDENLMNKIKEHYENWVKKVEEKQKTKPNPSQGKVQANQDENVKETE